MPKKDVKMLELTPKQMKFVNIFIEKGTIQSARQCALDAGFAESGATVIASQLQNPKYYPHVVAEIERRRAELNRRYSISYKSHIQKLAELSCPGTTVFYLDLKECQGLKDYPEIFKFYDQGHVKEGLGMGACIELLSNSLVK